MMSGFVIERASERAEGLFCAVRGEEDRGREFGRGSGGEWNSGVESLEFVFVAVS